MESIVRQEHKPNFGYVQPTYGGAARLALSPMAGTKRPKFVALRTRRIVAENIKRRMNERYPNHSDKVKALAEDAGTSPSTVQRATDPERYQTGITIDILTKLAMGLRCEPDELLRESQQDRKVG